MLVYGRDVVFMTNAVIFDIVDKIYKAEQEAPIRLMIQLMKAGEKDVYIMREIHYSKNSYYEHKDAFIEKVYQCCNLS